MKEVKIKSSRDGKLQSALFYVPARAAVGRKGPPAPLVVGLHPWNGNHKDDFVRQYLTECKKRRWVLIHPNFRGPNNRPEACASELAVRDVLDATDYARRNARIDPKRIYLAGVSGGGHMTLIMAARAPKLWAAASAWVPISDLASWHAETKAAKRGYFTLLQKICGGAPGSSAKVDKEYQKRSPLSHLHKAAGLAIDINAGIHDGYTGSVPVSQSLRAFNALAKANGREEKMLSDEQIDFMTANQAVPPRLAKRSQDEPGRQHKVLFRREAGRVRVTIFAGGHEIDVKTTFNYLATKRI
ncbi:MAG: prolyl oligopeptidase family serine peptidase [Phycisphaerae bacterium]|nr:prolyl oligopeptidase family serine peptidase [Phycisphaerae bacterium]